METYGMALQEAAATGLPLLVMKGAMQAITSLKVKMDLFSKPSPIGAGIKCVGERFKKLSWLGENAARLAKNNHYSWKDAAKLLINHLK